MNYTTPTKVTESIKEFFRQINPTAMPVHLSVRREAGEQIRDCYNVVDRKRARDGGSRLDGWIIWEWPHSFLIAEHHGVWESPDGECVCVTPHEGQERRILFLPHAEIQFKGQRIPRKRMALRQHRVIEEFLRIQEWLDSRAPAPGQMAFKDWQYRQNEARMFSLMSDMERMAACRLASRKR